MLFYNFSVLVLMGDFIVYNNSSICGKYGCGGGGDPSKTSKVLNEPSSLGLLTTFSLSSVIESNGDFCF